jgi:DNA-binding SARP family transcriptional activator/class 3 adenylate cyclase
MEIRILGPLEVERDGHKLALGPKQQTLLAVLLVHRGAPVSVDRLVDDIYAGSPPATAAKSLQVHISRLRKTLGDGSRLQTSAGGYSFSPKPGELDLERFEELADRGRRTLAAGDATTASAELAGALALWRGAPLPEFRYADFAQAEIARLEELRLAALEDRIDADLAAGRQASLVAEVEALVDEHPLRERFRAQLMLALYRSGRQAEALETFQRARSTLVDELGIDPGRALRELERAILQQDPHLDLQLAPPPVLDSPPQRSARGVASTAAEREARKTVTAVYVGIATTQQRDNGLDPEALRRITSRAFIEISIVVESYGGTIEAMTGDGVSAVFGLPAVHEDDALRALRAASEIRERLTSLAEQLAAERAAQLDVRIGVSTGEVVTGGAAAAQPRATGEPLIVSHRLGQAAGAGETLLDDATRRLTRHAVVEPVSIDSMDALRLVGLADIEGAATRLVSPMVGRSRERRRLLDAFEQAVSDRSCQLFTILGAAGVGKSRLVREFLSGLESSVRVARGRCLPYGQGITFWPVLEAVKEIAQLDDTESLEESRSRIIALIGDGEAPEIVAQRVTETIGLTEATGGAEEGFSGIRRFLEAIGRHDPVVVVFDDIHWGETTFLDLVEHLADWCRGASILLLCMARPELLDVRPGWGGGKLNATSVLLEPLSSDECGQLVANLLGEAELAEEVNARITEAAEGNPLFVEEMLSILIDDGLLVMRGGLWTTAGDLTSVPVPPTIQALLAARLDRLGSDEREVIEGAAVEGKIFHRGSIEALGDGDDSSVAAHLGALVRKELIRPDRPVFVGEDAYRFRHLLIRDAAYDSIPKEVRARLHERHARWLEVKVGERAAEYEEIVGYHLERAFHYRAELGPVDEESRTLGRDAAERLGVAGRRAFLRSDAPAGANLISRAVAMLPADDPLRVELVPNVRVVQGLEDLSWADRVLTDAVEAAATAGDRRLAAHALVQRGFLRLFTGADVTPRELLDVSDRAIAVFEESHDELGLARAWRLAAQAHYLDRRAARCAEASERALLHVRHTGDRFEEQEIIEWLVIALILGPEPAESAILRCSQLLGDTAEGSSLRAEILAATAPLLAMQRRETEADDCIKRARAIMDATGEWVWIATFWYAFVHLWRGSPAIVEAELREAYESLKEIGEKSHFSSIAHALANIVYAQGRYEEAEVLTQECAAACRANDVHSQVAWRSIQAKIFSRRQAFDEAERLAREAINFAAASDFLPARADALADLAEVLELAGRREEAEGALEDAIALYQEKGHLFAVDTARARLTGLA